ncbi:MAG: hypothetical protein KDD58_09750 [Bdellovibrionales bacterium]|nr:hypothetical protein [Bdellovibrionales bacterium]
MTGSNADDDCRLNDTGNQGGSGFVENECSSDGAGNNGVDGQTLYIGPGGTEFSTAIFRPGRTLTNSFVGEGADAINTADDGNGEALFSSINFYDWFNFSNLFSFWGKNLSFPNPASQGWCSTGTCQIFDWRLKATDTTLLNLSGNGATANQTFVAGSICPVEVHGDRALTDEQSTYGPNTFLISASEILLDDYGDDDGLCESNEHCIYSPNIGHYQGEGDYLTNGVCNFQDGIVHDVNLYSYPINGI